MNLNKAMIIGNLTRDPEVRTTPSGQNVASFSVATSLIWTDNAGQQQKKTEFHNIVAWRKLADICGQYLKKGSKVYVEGRLQTTDWIGNDGVKKYRTEIVAENMIMLDRAGGNENFGSGPATPRRQEEELPTINADEEEEIRVENIPF
ncbi:MAG TPA: single-stranded DNA-binding protein [bacterium]|nr:MAG: Single-stranded DNA-binding protein [Parcubacteria group bacterium ADurb.Bin115]HNU81743.1 single-stranded DNA-binding protein [bacterium]